MLADVRNVWTSDECVTKPAAALPEMRAANATDPANRAVRRCPSFLRLNAQPAASLIPKRHDGSSSRYNVCGLRDRHGRRLAWARALVLTKLLSI
jgi:hypothetical protein